MASLGIDFGTSNCSAHAASATEVAPIPLDGDEYLLRREAADETNKAYWDQTFFSMLDGGRAIMFGTPA